MSVSMTTISELESWLEAHKLTRVITQCDLTLNTTRPGLAERD